MSSDVVLTLTHYGEGRIAVACQTDEDAQALADLAKEQGVYSGRLIQESAGEFIPPVIVAVSSGAASAIYTFVFRNKHRAVHIERPDGLVIKVTGHSEDEERRIIREALGDDDGQ